MQDIAWSNNEWQVSFQALMDPFLDPPKFTRIKASVKNKFSKKVSFIGEKEMMVEMKNVHQLIKGEDQQGFCLYFLSWKQKIDILKSLDIRHLYVDHERIIFRAMPS